MVLESGCCSYSVQMRKNKYLKYLIPRLKPALHPEGLDSKLYRKIYRDNVKSYRCVLALYRDTELYTAYPGFRFNALLNSRLIKLTHCICENHYGHGFETAQRQSHVFSFFLLPPCSIMYPFSASSLWF